MCGPLRGASRCGEVAGDYYVEFEDSCGYESLTMNRYVYDMQKQCDLHLQSELILHISDFFATSFLYCLQWATRGELRLCNLCINQEKVLDDYLVSQRDANEDEIEEESIGMIPTFYLCLHPHS